MKQLLAALLLAIASSGAMAGDFVGCQEFFPGVPPVATKPGQIEVCHKGGQYAVLYNTKYRAAEFCAEVLSTTSIYRAAMETRKGDNALFHESTQVPPPGSARLQNFKGSGYDRGHLCPYADLGPSTNDLIQIQMQDPTMNREPWAKLESDTRKYVKRTDHIVYVITGVVFGDSPKRVNGVAVPTHFWKLVSDPVTNKSWAHIMPNKNDAKIEPPVKKEVLEAFIGYKLMN